MNPLPLKHRSPLQMSIEGSAYAAAGQSESETGLTLSLLPTDSVTESMVDSVTRTLYGASVHGDSFFFGLFQVAVPALFSMVLVCGLAGNMLVICVILVKRKLRTVTNLMLLNLALSDVSFLLVCGTFTVVHYALTVWPLGDPLCRIIQYLLYVTAYVTVYTLMAVSAVRYVTVVYGTQSTFIRSKKNIIILITCIWWIFLLAKIPVLVVHGVSTNIQTNRTECIISGRTEAQQLFASFFVFAYAFPLLVIGTMYCMIVCHLRNQKRTATPLNGVEERSKHVTRIVVLLVTTFGICWLPLHVHLLVAYYGKLPDSRIYKILLIIWHCLTYVNSCLNPLIYNYFSKDFREGFREMVCCVRPPTRV